MFLIITIVLSILVGLNFLLLSFSCNKTTKRVSQKEKTKVIKHTPAIQQTSNQLAPTGS